MNQMQWLRIALVLLLALGLALPAMAQVRDPRLSDPQEPGSAIVFPKFIYNTGGSATIGGEARSEFEISVIPPPLGSLMVVLDACRLLGRGTGLR